jgi:hypothetical protein
MKNTENASILNFYFPVLHNIRYKNFPCLTTRCTIERKQYLIDVGVWKKESFKNNRAQILRFLFLFGFRLVPHREHNFFYV